MHNDRESYRLTTLQWARNLEDRRDEVVKRWGTKDFRTFQLYLWGCVDGFERDQVQGYRWVLQLPVPGKREPC